MSACMDSLSQLHQKVNIYMDARLKAGITSREKAVALLPFEKSTLDRIESNKRTPEPYEVLAMSEVYGRPQLILHYCSNECPIGRKYSNHVKEKCLTESVLSLIKELNDVKRMKERLIEIAADGQIDAEEKPDWDCIMKELDDLAREIETLRWWARSQLKKQKPAAAVAKRRVNHRTKRAATAAR